MEPDVLNRPDGLLMAVRALKAGYYSSSRRSEDCPLLA